jgi:ATP-binding cassette, subfamily B, bacterial CvaB/MchF/RaxB
MAIPAAAAIEGEDAKVKWRPIFGRSVPVLLQSEASECGITCVAMIASYHGFLTDLASMRQRLATSLKGVTLKQISRLAESIDLTARGVQAPLEGLGSLRLPAILHWDMNHFVVLTKVTRKDIEVHDPARGRRLLKLAEVSRHFTGVALELTPTPGFRPRDERERISAWQLLGAARSFKGTIAQIFLISLALEVFAIASPFFLQLVVDRVIVGRDVDFLTVLGVGFLMLVVIQSGVSVMRAWVGVYLSTQINLRMLTELFSQLIRLPLDWFEKRHIGDLISRFRSIDAVQKTLTTTFVETVIDGVMVLFTLLVMVLYSTLLTGVVLSAAIIYALARWAFYRPQRDATDEQLAHEAKSSTHFIETVRGIMAIKLNTREEERRSAYQNLVVDHINAGVRVQQVLLSHKAINTLIFGIENVTVIWLGALAVLGGRLTVGMLYAFIAFKLLFLGRINALIDKLVEFNMLDLHAERIAEIALAEPEPRLRASRVPEQAMVIEADHISFAYGVEGAVFSDVSCTIKTGEMIALVGPSGCGKTTLIKVLVGLLPPTSGTLKVNGVDVREIDLADYRHRIGVVMQEDQLFVGTIEDNISFFDPAHDTVSARECATLAGITDEINAMPMGFNTIVGNMGVALSGGQKQRILLARALYRKPQIVFLDESFDQLDLDRENMITEGLRKLGYGIVIVSHRPDTVRSVDRVIEMAPVH